MENKNTISLWEYEQLLRAQERVKIIERMFARSNYVSTGDIEAVLDIPEKPKTAAEAVQGG